jgi:hypothetical protein
MLLDALIEVEKALGFPAHTPLGIAGQLQAGSLVWWESWDLDATASSTMWNTLPALPNIKGLQEAFMALMRRAAETKDLLRRSMGL